MIGLCLAACAPPSRSNRCEYWGDFGGSSECAVSQAQWNSDSNITLLTLEGSQSRREPSALIKIVTRFEGAPVAGSFPLVALEGNANDPAHGVGCWVWFFSQVTPGDNSRNSATFGGDPAHGCSLELEAVIDLGEGRFEVHGTLRAGVMGGMSVHTPLKRAQLFAGF